MIRNRLMALLGLFVVASMILAACGTPTPAPTEPPAPATEVPPTPEPTPIPVRDGAWLDSVVFSVIDSPEAAVTQLKADQIDVYPESSSNAEVFKSVKDDANLAYSNSFGSYTEITFNPVLKFSDGRLNPFGDPKIREAVNMIVDRDYIVQEIYGGLAAPKLLPLNSAFPDYARYVDTARALEAKYAFNFDKGNEIIKTQMEANGATLGADGKWQYEGKPVELTYIIRIEDERKPTGDYIAGQLEKAGFTVIRDYKKRADASPIWNRSNPSDGLWNLYTGGWITTAVSRDDATNFAYFYSNLGSGSPLWQAYTPSDEYFGVSNDLWTNNFKTMDERGQLFRKAMELALQDSVRVWLVDQKAFSPKKANVTLAYDLAGGISGSRLWPYTARFSDKEGGELRIAMNGVLIDPWNPLGGSNWISDSMIQRATSDVAAMPDPYTGLAWPQRFESASVLAKEGLPIAKTLDWVDLQFQADAIAVPEDAWVDWDPIGQKFWTAADAAKAKDQYGQVEAKSAEIAGAVDLAKLNDAALVQAATDLATAYGTITGSTVDVAAALTGSDDAKAAVTAKVEEIKALASDDEKKAAIASFAMDTVGSLDSGFVFGLGQRDVSTALTKTTVVYPKDLFSTVKWHDGSPLSMGDFVMGMILGFDQGKPASAIYDESAASSLESFLSHFKGVKIVSTDPLTIETYDDFYLLDAELMPSTWWPAYSYGTGAWHNLALGVQADGESKLAFTSSKADTLTIEWMSYVAGPSLDILNGYLEQDAGSAFIPYAPTLGQFVTADEAKARYANLQAFYAAHGHFWIGTGPFVLEKVFPTEKTVTLARFADFPDKADKWDRFGEPKISTVVVDGPGQVKIGDPAEFTVTVTFKDQPYPAAEISAAKYLLFNAKGELVSTGDATAAGDGAYTVSLSADVTKGLESGGNKLEVAVSSAVVSIPTFSSFEFVTAP